MTKLFRERLIEALTADFEQGVHWLGNIHADRLKRNYPNLWALILEIIDNDKLGSDEGVHTEGGQTPESGS